MIIKSKNLKNIKLAINILENNFSGIKFNKIEQDRNLFYSESILNIKNELKFINLFFYRYKFFKDLIDLETSLNAK